MLCYNLIKLSLIKEGNAMVNLELYRIFTIVADEENLTRASNILHISQPAVTKHIKNLENELNVKLFKRTKYGMVLTESGEKLYSKVKNSINTLTKADLLFNKFQDINLGVHINMPSEMYSKGISKFYEENKSGTINILKLIVESMFDMLSKQKIDLAFSKKYSEDIYDTNIIKFIKLGYLHDVFAVNSNSKYLGKKLSKNDLRQTTIYTLKSFSSAYQNLKESLEFKPDDEINIKNVTYSGIIEILKSQDIIAVITEEYIKDKLENKELCLLDTDLELEPAEYGIYYNINNKSKELKILIEAFKSSMQDIT